MLSIHCSSSVGITDLQGAMLKCQTHWMPMLIAVYLNLFSHKNFLDICKLLNKCLILTFLSCSAKLTPSQAVAQYAASCPVLDYNEASDNEILMPDSPEIPLMDGQESSPNDSSPILEAPQNGNVAKKACRWKWTNDMIENLILSLHDLKSRRDYEGKDLEADPVKLYEDLRQMLAKLYSEENFGPVECAGMNKIVGTKLTKNGYGRIRERVKLLRRNFKRAVVEGTRSGSGKLMIENWDRLVFIWGGCPSVIQIKGAVFSQAIENVGQDESSLGSEEESVTDEEDTSEKDEPIKPMKHTIDKSNPGNVKMKLIDKKRLKLEKPLSAQQRDQVMVRLAREELDLKKKNAETLEQSAKCMEKMVETMSQSLTALGQQLGNGLMVLAQALASSHQTIPPAYQPQYNPFVQQQHQQLMNAPNPGPAASSPGFRSMLSSQGLEKESEQLFEL